MDAIVSIRDMTVDFDQGHRFVRALHGISLEVGRGETIGIVGESGCGKSITWLAALGLLGKRARIGGRVMMGSKSLLEMEEDGLAGIRGGKIAMIFQDPSSSLNPVHRIGRQIGEALRLHRGLRGSVAQAEAKRLLDRVGISNAAQRLNAYPHELSGGMNQRAMIAMALAGEPEILIADEPTTALDVTIQAQILDLLRELSSENEMALVLISHDLGVVADMTERVAVMYCGRIIEQAQTGTLFARPVHPYTTGLIAALPDIDGPKRRLASIPGTVPPPDRLPAGCSFSPRCAYAEQDCVKRQPVLTGIGRDTDHDVSCLRATELAATAGGKTGLRNAMESA